MQHSSDDLLHHWRQIRDRFSDVVTATVSNVYRSMNAMLRRDVVVSFLLGIAAVILVHQVAGWWLDSQFGVNVMSAVLAVVSASLTSWRHASFRQRVIALWIGVMGSMAGVMLRIGPGSIWPIVLVGAGLMTAVAIGFGVFVGSAISSVKNRKRS
jgi:hypothetical protein